MSSFVGNVVVSDCIVGTVSNSEDRSFFGARLLPRCESGDAAQTTNRPIVRLILTAEDESVTVLTVSLLRLRRGEELHGVNSIDVGLDRSGRFLLRVDGILIIECHALNVM